MKMKRWISMLLTLALCLGLLPGAVLAEGTTVGLQLYAADDTTPITTNEDGSYIVNISENVDTIVYVKITGDNTAVFDEGTEFVVSVDGPPVPIVDSTLSADGKSLKITHHGNVDSAYLESGRNLSIGGQSVGLTVCFVPTVIYDDKDNSSFTVTADKEQSFTFPPHVYIGKTLTRITNENYTFTCDEEVGSLFWHDEYNELAINTSGITGVATGKIYASNKTDPTKVYACTVTVKVPSGGGNEDDSGAEEDVSADNTKIYDDRGACEFTVSAGEEQAFTFPPHVYINGTSTRLVAEDFTTNYTFTCDSEIGTLFWHEGFNELAINTTTATPGATGKISVTAKTDPTKVYTCTVTVKAISDDSNESDSSASGDDYTEVGLKLCTDQAGTTEVPKVNGVYNVEIGEGITTVVYLYITGGENAVLDDDTNFTMTVTPPGGPVTIVSSELIDNNTVLKITHHGDRDWATMENTRTITVGEEEFSFAIKFVNPNSGTAGGDTDNDEGTEETDPVDTTLIYDDKGKNGVTVSAGDSEAFTFPPQIYIDGTLTQLTYEDYTTNYTFTCGAVIGKLFWHTKFNELGIDTTNATPGTIGTITATNNSDSDKVYTYTVTIMAASGDGDEGGSGTEGGDSTGTTLESGVYTTLTDGQLGGYVEMAKIYGDDGPSGYRVPYTTGQSVTVYYYHPNEVYTCDSRDVDYVAVEGMYGVHAITLHAGKNGEIIVNLTCGERNFPIMFDDGTSGKEEPSELQTGVYTTLTDGQLGGFIEMARIYGDEGPWGYRVPYTTSQSVTVYYYNPNQVHTCNSEDADYAAVEGIDGVYAITLHTGKNGEVFVNLTYGEGGFPIVFDDGTDSGGNQGGPSGDALIEAAHELEADEIYASDRINEHMGAFSLPEDNNTYYMVPSMLFSNGTDYPHLNGDSSSYTAQSRLMFIEFWVGLGQNNYARVKDTATLAKIQEQFGGTLKMELLAATYDYYDYPLPKEYPATYTTTEVDAWRQPIMANFDFGSEGTWVYCASGTINGKLVTAEVRSTIQFRGDIIWSPDTNSNIDVITQVNNYLETVELPDNFGLIVNLPEGVYYGYITVPSRLSQDGISINGAYDEKTGIGGTTLYGGVQGENRRTHVNGIHFIGGGSGNGDKTWKGFSDKRSVNNGKDNYAFYGYCGGSFGNCIFENYYCAVLTTGETKTGTNSLFENNQTAVCYDSTDWGGIGDSLANNVYQSNEIAIHFAQFTESIGLSILSITESCFVDNKTDIRNDIKRNIYVPGNYFAYTNNGVETTRECQYLPKAKGNKEKLVHYYPQSANRQFNAWIYDMSFYKHDPVVSANLAATYKIPAEYLTKSVTVMNEDEALAVWTFGKKEEE